jgi:ubiquinone/menaquinone biosynthesis C-methylase UbiE
MKFSKFFSTLQEAPWYRQFLDPVINIIENKSNLLDIGTGSGKMLEILALEKNVKCVGTDTSEDMLQEAKEKLKNLDIELRLTQKDELLTFEDNSFDYITICSVLFHLKKEAIDTMLKDAQRMLNAKGKIIILTPTGAGNVMKLSRHFFSLKNKGALVWFRATKNRAQLWTAENYLSQYAAKNKLKYKHEIVMKGFAQIEILEE